jgi:hypothetical protein
MPSQRLVFRLNLMMALMNGRNIKQTRHWLDFLTAWNE